VTAPGATSDEVEGCTGTVIAPNVVLTARHCVAQAEDVDCSGYGPTHDPGAVGIFVGTTWTLDQAKNAQPHAVGTRITVPPVANTCSYDIAIIELNTELTHLGATVVPVRFTPLVNDEPTVAIGYGNDGHDDTPETRMQRQTKILGVGPTELAYQTQSGGVVHYSLPQGDVATGEATCNGDSGGSLVDANGSLVAVTSRGIALAPNENDGTHGDGACLDLPSVYAGVRFNEATIRQAVTAAGYQLPPTPTWPGSGGAEPGAGPGGATALAADGSTSKKPRSATTTHDGTPSAHGGCSSGPSQPDGPSARLALLLGAAVFLRRRRGRARG
jgi:MYXO-CTERM domain-containing protein